MNELSIVDHRDRPSLAQPLADAFVFATGLARGLRAWWLFAGTAGMRMARAAHSAATLAGHAILQSRQHPVASGESGTASDDAADIRFQRDMVSQLDAAYNFARFLSRDADAAQDIVQEAFLRAYRGFGGFQGGDARAWIFAIVRNCYHDWLLARRRKARLEVETAGDDGDARPALDDVASDDDDPETALLRRTDAAAVRDVLGKLPRPLREMLVLREIEGLSYRQIADIAALPIGTVMSRLARARAQFQAAWRRQTEPREARS